VTIEQKLFYLISHSALTETNGCKMQQVVNFDSMTSEVDMDREMEAWLDLSLNKLLGKLSSSFCRASKQDCKG